MYGLSYGLSLYTDIEFNNLTAELQKTVTDVIDGINAGEIDVTEITFIRVLLPAPFSPMMA